MERHFFEGQIKWFSPADKPVFNGTMSTANGSGKLMLTGMLGKDSIDVLLEKVSN